MHEPKGVASASADQVYRADGAGSGSWQTLTIPTGLFAITFATFTASGTWTKPSGLFKARIHVIASGGTGLTGLGNGVAGGNVSFGAHCSATGGGGGTTSAGTGGTGSSGDINLTGSDGYVMTSSVGADFCTIPGGIGAGSFAPKGQGGANSNTTGASGSGGGGGYSMKEKLTADLGATETVTIGSTGMNNGFVVVEQYISL